MIYSYFWQSWAKFGSFIEPLLFKLENGEKINLALLDIQSQSLIHPEIEEIILSETSSFTNFNLVDRNTIDTVVNELSFNLTGLTTNKDQLFELGVLLSANYLLLVGSDFYRIVEVNTGRVVSVYTFREKEEPANQNKPPTPPRIVIPNNAFFRFLGRGNRNSVNLGTSFSLGRIQYTPNYTSSLFGFFINPGYKIGHFLSLFGLFGFFPDNIPGVYIGLEPVLGNIDSLGFSVFGGIAPLAPDIFIGPGFGIYLFRFYVKILKKAISADKFQGVVDTFPEGTNVLDIFIIDFGYSFNLSNLFRFFQ